MQVSNGFLIHIHITVILLSTFKFSIQSTILYTRHVPSLLQCVEFVILNFEDCGIESSRVESSTTCCYSKVDCKSTSQSSMCIYETKQERYHKWIVHTLWSFYLPVYVFYIYLIMFIFHTSAHDHWKTCIPFQQTLAWNLICLEGVKLPGKVVVNVYVPTDSRRPNK